ncbi:MAG: hypothetical protein ACTSX7_15245 [Alphaproteobacteria bacterium]
MTKLNESDWRLINAYADGELSAASTAELTQRLPQDAALAAALAEIRTVKQALSRMGDVQAAQPRPAAPRLARRLALAASVALVLFGAGLLGRQALLTDWRDAPAELHAALSANSYVLSDSTAVTIISTARIGDVAVLDLSPSRLTLADVKTAHRQDRDVVAMHYRGRRGCRVTVIAIEALPNDPAPSPARNEGLSVQWSVGAIHYYLLAGGMDADRFDAIVSYAQAESRRLEGRDTLRLAMNTATEKAQPCV